MCQPPGLLCPKHIASGDSFLNRELLGRGGSYQGYLSDASALTHKFHHTLTCSFTVRLRCKKLTELRLCAFFNASSYCKIAAL